MTREDIVKEALSWEGTAYQHQQSLKGVACDCVGFVRGVYCELTRGKELGQKFYDYSATWHLYKEEEKLYNECKKYMNEIEISNIKLGDILIFGFGKGPAHHMGIYIGDDIFMHSWSDAGKVAKTKFNYNWRKRLRAAFSFCGVI